MSRKRFEVTDKVLDTIRHSAAIGLNKTQTAAVLGIHRDTFLEREKEENSRISGAIEEGKGIGVQGVVNALHEKAMTGDITAIKYYLNNRSGKDWSDKQGLIIDGQVDHTIEAIGLPETLERINGIIGK